METPDKDTLKEIQDRLTLTPRLVWDHLDVARGGRSGRTPAKSAFGGHRGGAVHVRAELSGRVAVSALAGL